MFVGFYVRVIFFSDKIQEHMWVKILQDVVPAVLVWHSSFQYCEERRNCDILQIVHVHQTQSYRVICPTTWEQWYAPNTAVPCYSVLHLALFRSSALAYPHESTVLRCWFLPLCIIHLVLFFWNKLTVLSEGCLYYDGDKRRMRCWRQRLTTRF
jgi:hypothetical protein